MRGSLPLLERWLDALLARQFEGSNLRGITKDITEQCVEPQYNLEFRLLSCSGLRFSSPWKVPDKQTAN